jgi:translation initiation factor 2 subunit 2
VEDYLKTLERARSKLPPTVDARDRYDLPKANIGVTGNRTIFYNFMEFTEKLRRKPEHVLKFLTREMATAASIEKNYAVFQGRFTASAIERLIARYVEEFVRCPVCKKPDSRMEKQGRLTFLVCEACGARSSLRAIV